MGIVYKENFDEEDDSKYHITNYNTEKRENATLKEKREREEKTKEESSKAYDEWIQLKTIRDQAIRCLALLDPPILCVGSRDLGLGSIGTGPKSAWLSSVNKNKKDEGVQFVIDVRILLMTCYKTFDLLYFLQ